MALRWSTCALRIVRGRRCVENEHRGGARAHHHRGHAAHTQGRPEVRSRFGGSSGQGRRVTDISMAPRAARATGWPNMAA